MVRRQESVRKQQVAVDTVDSANPPWERTLPSVPYMSSSTAPLSSAERDALPALWAAREQEHIKVERAIDSPQPSTASTLSPASPRPKPTTMWSQQDRDSQDSARRNAQSPSMTMYSTTDTTENNWAPLPRRPTDDRICVNADDRVQALPGTMSANAVHQRHTHRERRVSDGDSDARAMRKQRQNHLGKWLRAAIHDMFKRDPIDESDLERIEGHHWAEDKSPM